MMRLLLLGLLCVRSLAFAADVTNAIAPACDHLMLVPDPQLTRAIEEQKWATGEPVSGNPAALELHGCNDELLDRMVLDAPLARLDPTPLRGTQVSTYLVTEDLTAPAGSYSGPLTILVEVAAHRIKRVDAYMPHNHREPINLALTGKAAWKKIAAGPVDDFLSASCQPQTNAKNNGFTTTYRRYHLTAKGWEVRVRSEPIFWESDEPFPETRHFPEIRR